MADAYLNLTYSLLLTDKEMRLVCLALAGKLNRWEDRKDAGYLNLKLLKLQQIRIREKMAIIEGNLTNAESEEEQPEEEE